jgi:putative endonuclease
MITVYVLEGIETGKRYVGITNNLQRRLLEHHSRKSKGGQIIDGFRVVYTEQYADYGGARLREKFLKSGKGREWLDEQRSRSWPARGG